MQKKVGLLLTVVVFMLFLVTPVLADTLTLSGTVRDFKYYNASDPTTNPDFENVEGVDPGIVQSTLGVDGKPVYAGRMGNPTTHGKWYFDQWYRDVAGTNIAIPYTLTLAETSPGIYTYSNRLFFPIDGQGFGNQGASHNYSFTYELHTQFTYVPGQDFGFRGDDDVFVFINHQLVVDLGGVHPAQSASVDLDSLGLTDGETYDFDFFFAERHTGASSMKIQTSIPLQTPVVPIPSAVLLLAPGLAGLVVLRRRVTR
jgi:fibro-slime domain-containing protein